MVVFSKFWLNESRGLGRLKNSRIDKSLYTLAGKEK